MIRPIYIRGARIVDPASRRDEVGDLYVRDGRIAETPPSPPPDALLIDGADLTVVPGLIDLHVHLREPGNEDAETVETGSRAAAHGGFTAVVAMPNTNPPTDTRERVAHLRQLGEQAKMTRVIPAGCISIGREGRELAPLAEMARAGALAFTDDGATVASEDLMLEAMARAKDLNLVIMDHAEDADLEKRGVMHEGHWSRHWKLPGIPPEAEIKTVARDIRLAERTGCALHIQHVSARESAGMIRDARKRGLRVSGELTPHHLALTDEDVRPDNANFKMNPPLRSKEDREALIQAVCDGTLQAFATDHAPHTAAAKAKGFADAPPGVVGLETAVGITYTELVARGLMDLPTWVRRWTSGPAGVLGIPEPTLRAGAPADLAVLDLKNEWTVRAEAFCSKSRNTPFEGRRLTGRAILTVFGGVLTWIEQ